METTDGLFVRAAIDGSSLRLMVKPGATEEDLRDIADRLLTASLGILGRGEYPFYSDAYLRRLDAEDRAELAREQEAADDTCL